MLSLNSSPYTRGKPEYRATMVCEVVNEFVKVNPYFIGVAYCNQYGAQDELVFDGNSFMRSKAGTVNRIVQPIIPWGEKYAVGVIATFDIWKHSMPAPTYSGLPGKAPPRLACKVPEANAEHWSLAMLGLFDYAKKTGFKLS